MPIKKLSMPILLLISIIITFIFTASSCSESGGGDTEEAQGDTVAESAESTEEATALSPYEARKNVSDDLPEKDFGGYDFTIYLREEEENNTDFVAEAETGDIINDAVFKRNRAISERFNVNIKFNFDTTGNTTYDTTAVNAIRAGDDVNDVLALHGAFAFVYAKQGYLVDWKTDLPYVNLEKPWWDRDFTDNMAMANRLFAMTGDISHLNISATFCLAFNKNLFTQYAVEYPYQSVIDGTWTFDKFAKIIKDSSLDLNGDGVQSKDADLFGLTTGIWGAPIQAFYMAGDRVITIDKEGVPSLTVYNERTVSIFQKFFDMVDTANCYIEKEVPIIENVIFRGNRSMFSFVSMGGLVKLRNMESDIGIIPFPKFDESVDKYYSLVDAGRNIFAVPIIAGDLERTSIILEAFASEGYKSVVPVFYEQALQVKYARDDDSAQMLDIIRDGRIFDYGYFDSTSSADLAYVGRNLVDLKGHDFTSFYESREAGAKKNLEKLYEQYLTE